MFEKRKLLRCRAWVNTGKEGLRTRGEYLKKQQQRIRERWQKVSCKKLVLKEKCREKQILEDSKNNEGVAGGDTETGVVEIYTVPLTVRQAGNCRAKEAAKRLLLRNSKNNEQRELVYRP